MRTNKEYPFDLIADINNFPYWVNMQIVEDTFDGRLHLLFEINKDWLSTKEKQVIISYYKNHNTLQSIADGFNVSRERARQIVDKAVRKLRLINDEHSAWFYRPLDELRSLKQEREELVYNLRKEVGELRILLDKAQTLRFNDDAKIGEVKKFFEENDITYEPLFNLSIEDLDFSTRTYHCLKRAKVHSINDLLNYSEKDLLEIRNLGYKSVKEIIEKLNDYGYDLKTN